MIQVTSVHDPRWANREQTAVDCFVTVSHLGGEVIPMTVHCEDKESHAKNLYAQLVLGQYGEIKPFGVRAENDFDVFPTPPSGSIDVVVFGE